MQDIINVPIKNPPERGIKNDLSEDIFD